MTTRIDCAGCWCWRLNNDQLFACTGDKEKSCRRNNAAAQEAIFGEILTAENTEKSRPNRGGTKKGEKNGKKKHRPQNQR